MFTYKHKNMTKEFKTLENTLCRFLNKIEIDIVLKKSIFRILIDNKLYVSLVNVSFLFK